MTIKDLMRRLILGVRSDSDTYIAHLRSLGISIGKDCTIYVPSKTVIDEQYPWMISIGDHVRITEGVKILTHDYAWSVLKGTSGAILGASGEVVIGNNVFIGMNSIITRNVVIGNNVIIGAGSVVTSNCEADSVYAGVPARRMMSIHEYFEKRKKAQLEEAKCLARKYYECYRKLPGREVFHEYFMLFENTKSVQATKCYVKKLELCNNEIDSLHYLTKHEPAFDSFEQFLEYCFPENP